MPHRVSHKSISGLQQIRMGNKKAAIGSGSAACLRQNSGKTLGLAEFCVPNGKKIYVDINTPGKNGVLDLPVTGIPDDGIYYMFIGSDGVPDSDGVLPFDSTYAYLSKNFKGYGVGVNPVPAGAYKRPLSGTFFIRNNRLEPCMSLSEHGHNWQRFQFDGYADWKAARDKNRNEILVPTKLRSISGTDVEITLENILPESHKWVELHAIIGGTGYVFVSNNANNGQLIGIAQGKEQVVTWKSMPKSEITGRALRIKTKHSAYIRRIYVLATQCQQPM